MIDDTCSDYIFKCVCVVSESHNSSLVGKGAPESRLNDPIGAPWIGPSTIRAAVEAMDSNDTIAKGQQSLNGWPSYAHTQPQGSKLQDVR